MAYKPSDYNKIAKLYDADDSHSKRLETQLEKNKELKKTWRASNKSDSTYNSAKQEYYAGKDAARNIKAEGKALHKATKDIYSESGAAISKTEGLMGTYTKNKTARINMKQRANLKPAPGLKYVAPGAENMFTGIRMSKGGIGLAALGIAAMSVYSGISGAMTPPQNGYSTPAENMGSLSSMSYDGSGNVQNGSRTLGATGDLVFGLSKMRRVK